MWLENETVKVSFRDYYLWLENETVKVGFRDNIHVYIFRVGNN